jgi:hypothetical protein
MQSGRKQRIVNHHHHHNNNNNNHQNNNGLTGKQKAERLGGMV